MENFDELYYQRPYLKEFDAEVISCEPCGKGYHVELNRTAFYPEGGGQPSDRGILQTDAQTVIPVRDVQKHGDHIVHTTDREIAVGTQVHGVIDWQRRMDYTTAHSGEHILSGLIHRRFGYENVGFHMSEECVTIDISGVMTWEELMEVERDTNAVIRSDVPVEESFPEGQELETLDYRSKKELTGKVRIITIPGADICACCGTHVMRTGEIGMVKCLSMIHYKKGVRIELVCGRKALLDYERKVDQNTEISHMLSAKPYETAEAVARVQQELAEANQKLNAWVSRYFDGKMKELEKQESFLIDFEENIDRNSCRKFCDRLVKESMAPTCAVITEQEDEKGVYAYCICSSAVNLRNLTKTINSSLDGRGGGSPEMIQGSFHAEKVRIQEVLTEIFRV